ncbi:MAG: 3-phosphoshikimate 1-carboxyvinyltransferase [Flavobacteriales bacterium]|nr:3-phosphoshikimate 1-carboxyvinyltransferase [Flavobacteriales bacterium]
MNIHLLNNPNKISGNINITGSKSESNRLLILQALYSNIKLKNISNSDDTNTLKKALSSSNSLININHAGTAMRFLTAYFAIKLKKETVLTGSKRMTERPIKILVDALLMLGAEISYEGKMGFPPIKIKNTISSNNFIELPSSTSSQYISSLILIAPKMSDGLTIQMSGIITSLPYIKMTVSILKKLGIDVKFNNNKIIISNQESIDSKTINIESDWSSSSYFFSIIALSEDSVLRLNRFNKNSLQGDSILRNIYEKLGVSSHFEGHNLVLKKIKNFDIPDNITINLIDSPDIAQTIAVTCFGLGISCDLTGLHTLKIKETDRLKALKNELTKLGAKVSATNESIHIKPSSQVLNNIKISTYQDHRMAMAFAPLAIKTALIIEDSSVVSKSYPGFWSDLQSIGFQYIIK